MVRDKVEEELLALSEEQPRLVGSLAERFADGKPTVVADRTFLLLSGLIVPG